MKTAILSTSAILLWLSPLALAAPASFDVAIGSDGALAPSLSERNNGTAEKRYIKPNIIHVQPGPDGSCNRPGWINVRFEDTGEIYGKYAQLTMGVVEQCGNVWRFDPATVNENKFKVRKGDASYECNMNHEVKPGMTPNFIIKTNSPKEDTVHPCNSVGITLVCGGDNCEKALLA